MRGNLLEFMTRRVSAEGGQSSDEPSAVVFTLNGVLGFRRSRVITGKLVEFMLSHPGLVFIVGGPGARPSFEELLMYRKPAERGPVVTRNHALSGLVAVCNAVSLLRGI